MKKQYKIKIIMDNDKTLKDYQCAIKAWIKKVIFSEEIQEYGTIRYPEDLLKQERQL